MNKEKTVVTKDNLKIVKSENSKGEIKELLALDTCAEYRDYLKSDNQKYKASEKYVPKDAKTFEEISKLSDEELLKLINRISKTPHKSDILVMYAEGLGFSWTKLKTLAESRGFVDTTDGSRTPIYRISKISENNNNSLTTDYQNHVKKEIHINMKAKKENYITRSYQITENVQELLEKVYNDYPIIQRRVLFLEILKSGLKTFGYINDSQDNNSNEKDFERE